MSIRGMATRIRSYFWRARSVIAPVGILRRPDVDDAALEVELPLRSEEPGERLAVERALGRHRSGEATNPIRSCRFAVARPPVAARHAASSKAATASVPRFILVATLTAVRIPSMRAAIAAGHPATVEAGIEVLEDGGSAADAAVAASLASCVAETVMTGLLGGGHAIHYEAATGPRAEPRLLRRGARPRRRAGAAGRAARARGPVRHRARPLRGRDRLLRRARAAGGARRAARRARAAAVGAPRRAGAAARARRRRASRRRTPPAWRCSSR